MKLGEYAAGTIQAAAEVLAHTISMMPAERVEWSPAADPASATRCALNQAAECIGVNRTMAALLRGEEPAPRSDERPFADAAGACEQIRASAAEFSAAVRALNEEDWTRKYTTQMGPMPGFRIVQIATGNMYYHFGQVNYIQTLYGDSTFHLPPAAFAS